MTKHSSIRLTTEASPDPAEQPRIDFPSAGPPVPPVCLPGGGWLCHPGATRARPVFSFAVSCCDYLPYRYCYEVREVRILVLETQLYVHRRLGWRPLAGTGFAFLPQPYVLLLAGLRRCDGGIIFLAYLVDHAVGCRRVDTEYRNRRRLSEPGPGSRPLRGTARRPGTRAAAHTTTTLQVHTRCMDAKAAKGKRVSRGDTPGTPGRGLICLPTFMHAHTCMYRVSPGAWVPTVEIEVSQPVSSHLLFLDDGGRTSRVCMYIQISTSAP